MGIFMALVLWARAALRHDLASLRPRSLRLQLVRGALDLANNLCVVVALHHLSLTMFYILIFTSPLLVAVLSRAFLGERITPTRALALLVGFCGVVIAVAPWDRAQRLDLIGVAACMVCVACFSSNMVWSRVLTRTETPESLAFCSSVMTAIAGAALTSVHAQPMRPAMAVLLAVMGCFCAAGTLCFYTAVKHTSAGNVSQYHYTQLLTGAVVSYLVWHDKPSVWIVAGGTLILGSGVLIALAARQTEATADEVVLAVSS